MRHLVFFLLLVGALTLGTLLGCTKVGTIAGINPSKGDAEAVNGGDTFDLIMGNTRNRLIHGMRRLQNGDKLSDLTSAPSDCAGSASSDLCEASLRLSSEQRDSLSSYLVRNASRVLALNSQAPVPVLIPSEEVRTLPSGRSVLAWVGRKADGQATITIHRSVLELPEPLRLALLAHEFFHLAEDSLLGHALTDDEEVEGFSAPEGSGRFFADSAGALFSLYTFASAPPPEPLTKFSMGPLKKILDHAGVFATGSIRWGDLDADGKDDLVYMSPSRVYEFYYSMGEGLTPRNAATDIVSWVGQHYLNDINGDGKLDLVLQRESNNHVYIYFSQGRSFGPAVDALTISAGLPYRGGMLFFGDVNGDKKDDLITQGTDNRIYVNMSTGTGFETGYMATDLPGDSNGYPLLVGDANADGRIDIYYQGLDFYTWAYLSNGTAFPTRVQVARHGGGFPSGTMRVGDMNLDGRADIVVQGNEEIHISPSKADGSFYGSFPYSQNPPRVQAVGKMLFADMNGDGAADVLFRGTENVVRVGLTGKNFPGELKPHVAIVDPIGMQGNVYPADLNGDGKRDLLYVDANNDVWVSLSTGILP